MQKRHHPHLAAAAASASASPSPSPSSSSGGEGSGFNDIMELDAGSGGDHKAPGTPTTPRSKHSATEQRRRCKINERFQILRDLIPRSDQKRDRATFLLEVIEYVKFLQEKVQKYEACTDWSQQNAKLIPWSSNRVPDDGMLDGAPSTKNGSATGLTFSDKFLDNSIPAAPEMLQNAQMVAESAELNADSIDLQAQSQWQQLPCPTVCAVNDEHDELAIDEGTISVSSVYSQNLFTALTNAMESSGLDLSQASVTVQVNLGRRAISRRPNNMCSAKERKAADQIMEDTGQTRSCEESEQALKRHRV